MNKPDQIVIFTLNGQRYGIPVTMVERVVRMVEITPLPAGPEFINGVINVQGEILPVVNIRLRFGLPERPIELSDKLIILRCASRRFVLMTDSFCDVQECTEQMQTDASEIVSGLPYLTAVVKLPDGLILLQDPEVLLTPAETVQINEIIGSCQA